MLPSPVARRAGCSLASRTRHAGKHSGAPGVTSVRRRNGAGAGALTRLSKGRAETLTTRLIPIPGARVKPGRAPASLMPAAFERGSRQGIETPQDWREQEVGSSDMPEANASAASNTEPADRAMSRVTAWYAFKRAARDWNRSVACGLPDLPLRPLGSNHTHGAQRLRSRACVGCPATLEAGPWMAAASRQNQPTCRSGRPTRDETHACLLRS